eukprot:5997593-Prymnesium_polylepis.1
MLPASRRSTAACPRSIRCFAAPNAMHSLSELPRRAAIGRWHGDGDGACCRQLGALAAASLADRIQEERWKQQRPFPASKVAGN